MKQYLTSGEVARALNTSEPRLNSLIRRGRVEPVPPIHSGRRLWDREHILQAAEVLGVVTDELRAQLSEELRHGS